jgi:hypothetical protein
MRNVLFGGNMSASGGFHLLNFVSLYEEDSVVFELVLNRMTILYELIV